MGKGIIMAHKLKKKKVVTPAKVVGLTTLAVVGSGLYANTAEASTIHTVRAGEFLQLIGQRHGVSVNQLRQWNNLRTDVLQIGQELIVAQPGGANTNQTAATGTRTVTASRLNVRSGAGTTHGVIGSIGRNQTVTVTGRTGNWYTINHNGRTGFISADFVTEQAPSQNNTNVSNNNTTNAGGTTGTANFNTQSMISFARQFVGVPYLWGGTTPSGFDCSGFIHFVLNNNGVSIGRTNVAGYWSHSRFQTVSNPQPGDFIFFQNTWRNGPSHMGIMINNTQFIHASSSRGVTISDVNNTFWRQHFLGFRRIR